MFGCLGLWGLQGLGFRSSGLRVQVCGVWGFLMKVVFDESGFLIKVALIKVVFDENFFDEIDHFHPNFDESVPNLRRHGSS